MSACLATFSCVGASTVARAPRATASPAALRLSASNLSRSSRSSSPPTALVSPLRSPSARFSSVTRVERASHIAHAAAKNFALLFDCDGVIVETEELHRLAYNRSFEYFGLTIEGNPVNWSPEYYDKLQNTVGGGKPKMRYHFNEDMGGKWPHSIWGAPPADDDAKTKLIDALQDKKTEFYKVSASLSLSCTAPPSTAAPAPAPGDDASAASSRGWAGDRRGDRRGAERRPRAHGPWVGAGGSRHGHLLGGHQSRL